MKHRLKMLLREFYARILFHTRLCLLVNRLMPARVTILAGHCVTAPSNAFLPKDMKISGAKLERILCWLGKRMDVVTVAEGVRRLDEGGPSAVCLSMDDGYRDNAEVMLPLLERMGVSATVYLVTSLLGGTKIDWSHKYFWMLERISPGELLERFAAVTRDSERFPAVREACAGSGDVVYHFKRYLKYDAEPAERDRALDVVFRELGGDEAAVANELLMDWELAKRMRDAGHELGAHTVDHPVLERLEPDAARAQIAGAREALEAELGAGTVQTFAYPFGRRWDYKPETRDVVRAAGFRAAVNTHSGANHPESERTELARIMIDEDARLHLIATEACGGFDLLRRFGLSLSE